MRILVLGGASNLGRVVTEKLLLSRHQVFVLSRTSPFSIGFNFKTISWLNCDRRDHVRLKKVFGEKEFDVVIDLSGYYSSDVKITIELLKDRTSCYLFMSSVAVATGIDGFPVELPIREIEYNVGYIDPYAENKAKAEQLILNYLKNDGKCKVIILRTGEIIGNSDKREHYFFSRATTQMPYILIPDNGCNIVHPTDVKDVADAICLLVISKKVQAGIYHVAGKATAELRDLVSAMLFTAGSSKYLVSVPLNYIRLYKKEFYYPFFPRSTIIQAEKIKKFGFEPQFSFLTSFIRSWTIFLAEKDNSKFFKSHNSYIQDKSSIYLRQEEEMQIIDNWNTILGMKLLTI